LQEFKYRTLSRLRLGVARMTSSGGWGWTQWGRSSASGLLTIRTRNQIVCGGHIRMEGEEWKENNYLPP